MSRKKHVYEPIGGFNPGAWISLDVYSPGAWFDSPMYNVFVGGRCLAKRKIFVSAKQLLLELAIEECDKRIAHAKAEAAHYERERLQLTTHGLRNSVTK